MGTRSLRLGKPFSVPVMLNPVSARPSGMSRSITERQILCRLAIRAFDISAHFCSTRDLLTQLTSGRLTAGECGQRCMFSGWLVSQPQFRCPSECKKAMFETALSEMPRVRHVWMGSLDGV